MSNLLTRTNLRSREDENGEGTATAEDLHKIIAYFTEIQNDFSKFDYEEAMCMIEYLHSTINYINAYILGNSNQREEKRKYRAVSLLHFVSRPKGEITKAN